MKVSFWGTRGSISTPGRNTEKYGGNTPCVSVRHGNTVIVMDAGTGVRNLGIDLAAEFKDRPEELEIHLFLSHTHWDHIQGIPFFQPAYMKGVKLNIYGSPKKRGVLKRILRDQMEFDYFPVDMSFMSCTLAIHELESDGLDVDDFHIGWQEQRYHPGGSIRYSVTRGESTMIYASDVELNMCFKAEQTADEKKQERLYREFVQGADLLIADGQFTNEEYANVVGWGHTSMELIMQIAHECKVKQLALFHHDPQHGDTVLDELFLKYHGRFFSAEPSMNVFWSRESVTLPI